MPKELFEAIQMLKFIDATITVSKEERCSRAQRSAPREQADGANDIHAGKRLECAIQRAFSTATGIPGRRPGRSLRPGCAAIFDGNRGDLDRGILTMGAEMIMGRAPASSKDVWNVTSLVTRLPSRKHYKTLTRWGRPALDRGDSQDQHRQSRKERCQTLSTDNPKASEPGHFINNPEILNFPSRVDWNLHRLPHSRQRTSGMARCSPCPEARSAAPRSEPEQALVA